MRFGIRLPVTGPFASRKSLIEIAQLADVNKFHSIWTQGHILWSRAQHESQISVGSVESIASGQSPNLFDSITTMAYTAALTSNVRLGFSVFIAPLVHPILAAKQLADVDVLSEGRLVFCTSPGGPLINHDFESLGVDFKKRAEIADEYIEAIIQLWTSDNCSFDGKYVKFRNVSLYPKPIQKPHPPVWIAGGDPNAVARVVRFGTGWMLTTADPRSVVKNISDYSLSLERLIRKASAESKRITDFALDIFASVARTDEEAVKIATRTIRARLDHQAKSATLRVPSEKEIEAVNLIGSPETITRKVEQFEKAGVNLLEMKMISGDIDQMKSMIKMFASDVMTRF